MHFIMYGLFSVDHIFFGRPLDRYVVKKGPRRQDRRHFSQNPIHFEEMSNNGTEVQESLPIGDKTLHTSFEDSRSRGAGPISLNLTRCHTQLCLGIEKQV